MTSEVMTRSTIQGQGGYVTSASFTSDTKTNNKNTPTTTSSNIEEFFNVLMENKGRNDDDDDDDDDSDNSEDDEDEDDEEEEKEEYENNQNSRNHNVVNNTKETASITSMNNNDFIHTDTESYGGKLLSKRKSMDTNVVVTDEVKLRKKVEERGQRLLQEQEPRWRESVRQQMETELSRRVREALETPPLERIQKRNDQASRQRNDDLNSHLLIDLTDREKDILRVNRWKAMQAKKMGDKSREMSFVSKKNLEWNMDGLKVNNQRYDSKKNIEMQFLFRDELCPSNHDQYPGVFGLGNLSEGIKNIRDDYSVSVSRYPGAKPKLRHFYTKEGFLKALRAGTLPNGVQFIDDCGTYIDKYGVVRNGDGPFWPVESIPMFATPRFKWWTTFGIEPFSHDIPRE